MSEAVASERIMAAYMAHGVAIAEAWIGKRPMSFKDTRKTLFWKH